MTVGTVLVDLKADTTHLVEGMKRAEASLKKIGDNAKDLAKIFGGLVVIDMFRSQITQAIDFADSLNKLSQKTGITADGLYSLSAAAKLSDVDFVSLESSLAKFSKGIGEASMGTGSAKDAFEKLGISIQNQDGTLKNSFVLLTELSDKFQSMPNGANKATVAMQLFGKSGTDMIPLLNSGSEALKKFTGIMNEDTARAAEEFNDSMTNLGITSNAFFVKVTKDLVPTLEVLSDHFLNLAEDSNELGDALSGKLSGAMKGVVKWGYGVASVFDISATAISNFSTSFSAMLGGDEEKTQEYFKKIGTETKKSVDMWGQAIIDLDKAEEEHIKKREERKKKSIEITDELQDRFTRITDETEAWKVKASADEEALKKRETLFKKHAEELQKFNDEQFALLALGSDKSFKQLDAGAIDYKEIEANAKTALDNMADKYQTYYETIGEYAKSWELKKFELSEKYNMLSTEELDKFLGKQEELYMSSFTKQKTEAQQAAEAMYQAFNGIHRQLESSFMSFFDHTSDKFMEFGDLATSILNQIINEMIRMSIVTPMVNSLMGMIGPTLGIGTGTTSTSSVTTVPQSYFRWQGGMFADGYLAGNGYASYDSIANDKIPALISKGEAVIPASVVNSNRELIASLIASRGQKFANGYMPHGSDLDGNIKVQIINESGQDMNVTSTRQSMDAEGMVLGIVIDGISKNKMGLRDMIGGR